MPRPMIRNSTIGLVSLSLLLSLGACGDEPSYGSGSALETTPYEPPSFEIGRVEGGRLEAIPEAARLGFDGATPEGWVVRTESGSTRGTSTPQDAVFLSGSLWILTGGSDSILEQVAVRMLDKLRAADRFDRIRFLPEGTAPTRGERLPDLVLRLETPDRAQQITDGVHRLEVIGWMGRELVLPRIATTIGKGPAELVANDSISASAEVQVHGRSELGFPSQVLVANVADTLADKVLEGSMERGKDVPVMGSWPEAMLPEYLAVPEDLSRALEAWTFRGAFRSVAFANQSWWESACDWGEVDGHLDTVRERLKTIGFEHRETYDARRGLDDVWVRGQEVVDLTVLRSQARLGTVVSMNGVPVDRDRRLRARLRIAAPAGHLEEVVERALGDSPSIRLEAEQLAALRTYVPEDRQAEFWHQVASAAARRPIDFTYRARAAAAEGDLARVRLELRGAEIWHSLLGEHAQMSKGLPKRLAARFEIEYPGDELTPEELDAIGLSEWSATGEQEFGLEPGEAVAFRRPDDSSDAGALTPRFIAAGRSPQATGKLYLVALGGSRSGTSSDDSIGRLALRDNGLEVELTRLTAPAAGDPPRYRLRIR